jgi:hypothetical protein
MKKIIGVLIIALFIVPSIQIRGEDTENSEIEIEGTDTFNNILLSIPKPTSNGDIIFAECKGFYDLPGADHAEIWDSGYQKIIEADPYYDVWKDFSAPWDPSRTLGFYYPWNPTCLKYLTYQSATHPNSTTWGRVESDTLEHDFWAYEWYKYYHVIAFPADSWRAIYFARDKIGKFFDFYSAWPAGGNTKQVDETSKQYLIYNNLIINLGGGYYCTELVWAAWVKGYVNLDTDTDAVMPQEIINENNNSKIQYYYTYPP